MELSANFKKYFSNTSWLFAEKIVRMIVGFTVGVWVARYLGPERLGIFSYAQSFVFLFSAFATLGLDGIVVRELVKTPERRDVLLGTSFVLKLIGAVLTLSLLGSAIFLSNTDKSTSIIMMLIGSATVFQAFNVIDFYFQSKVLSKYVVFAQATAMIVVNGIKIALIVNEADLVWFAGVVVVEALLISVGLVGYYLKSGTSIFKWVIDWSVAKELLRGSWPLILSGIMISLYMKIDQVMIMHILGAEANGQYAAAVKLSELWYFIPVIITASLFPAIIKAKDESNDRFTSKMTNLYSLLIIIALCFTITFTFFSTPISLYLYGGRFNLVSSVLSIHIWAGIFVSIGVASGKWLIVNDLQFKGTKNTAIGALINITLNLYLIPKMGITGAAVATLISYAIAAYLALFWSMSTRQNFTMISKAFNLVRFINVKKNN